MKDITDLLIILPFPIALLTILIKQWLKTRALEKEVFSLSIEFNQYTDNTNYFNYRKFSRWNKCAVSLLDKLNRSFLLLFGSTDLKKAYRNVKQYHKRGETIRKDYNQKFILKEIQTNKTLFDTIENYPLTDAQRRAAVAGEDHSLVVAGAGTGKTSTIVAKVAYLIKSRGVDPKDILLIAFTNNAVDEMSKRLKNRLDVEPTVMTFHKLGLEIIKKVEKRTPPVAFSTGEHGTIESFIQKRINSYIKDPKLQEQFIDFLTLYSKAYRSPYLFKSKGEYLAYLRSIGNYSLRNDPAKSQEEVSIANFLLVNSIDYVYEKTYQFQEQDIDHKPYAPDFYLPEYKIYIEHFGISEDGSVPSWFKSRGKKSATEAYKEGMDWKRKTHKRHNTILIETYSWERKKGILFKNLADKLSAYGVVFRKKSYEEIKKITKEAFDIDGFTKICVAFLRLVKENGYTIQDLTKKLDSHSDPVRGKRFIEIFAILLNDYNAYLTEVKQIDFGDMIITAAKYLKNNPDLISAKYILIDEFQDISAGRARLTKSLENDTRDSQLFCVGDDWQSIYRFNGSDLFLMTNFDSYWGATYTEYLDVTFRYTDQICNISSEFIQKNSIQLKKNLKTISVEPNKGISLLGPQDEEKEIKNYLLEKGSQKERLTVYLLGRYKHIEPEYLGSLKSEFSNWDIKFMTIHSSKGLEADYVIILQATNEKYGLPCQIYDDPLLSLALSEIDEFPYSEERRLFYVALTRARKGVLILTSNSKPSVFAVEMGFNGGANEKCPDCKSGVLSFAKDPKYGDEWLKRCSNYPFCPHLALAKKVEKTYRRSRYGRRRYY